MRVIALLLEQNQQILQVLVLLYSVKSVLEKLFLLIFFSSSMLETLNTDASK